MNKRIFTLPLTALLVSSIIPRTLFAQDQHFTMEEAVLGLRGGTLAPESLKQVQWIPNTNKYTQSIDINNKAVLITKDAVSKKTDTILKIQQINNYLGKADSLKSIPVIYWQNNNAGLFRIKDDWHQIMFTHQQLDKINLKWTLPAQADNITLDEDKNQLAYTIDNNLYLIDAYQNKHTISSEQNKHIIFGQSVHRNEFGIHNGIFFSPKGNKIAYYKMDETMVADYPIINWNTMPAQNQNIKYPMAGGVSHEVQIGVYNPITKKNIFLATGTPKDQYLTNISWSPDEKYIYVIVLNRAQKHAKLQQYDAQTGAFIKTLIEEKNDKYVEPQNPIYFLNNQEFVYWSQKDGFMHLYRYNIHGKLLNQITKGNWLVNSIIAINKESKHILVVANKEDARSRNLYSVNWTNGKTTRIDKANGVHSAISNSSGSYLIDNYSNENNPRTVDLISSNGHRIANLLTAKDKLTKYERPQVKSITISADDGTPLYGKLITPKNFDPNRKYPVIVYLYNGPHLQLVTNSYPNTGNLWYDYLTQRGYIVFTMDGRGSSNRGFKFESATHEHLGQIEMKDQLAGVTYLKSLQFVDANRMGVHGWSYGGFMTTSLMTQYPDVFKVGVAGGPVIDWNMYEIMYTERYMNAPQNNASGYQQAQLLDKVKYLKGKLLMIHGADDDVVVWQHSLKFIEASVKANIQVDYYAYPGHKHNVMGKDRVHLMQKITDYFDLYLKP